MIEISIPAVPLLGATGKVVRPCVLLYGAESGHWQRKVSQQLRRCAAQVIKTDVKTFPQGQLHPTTAWSVLIDYIEVADMITCWCGDDKEALYLNEWVMFTHALTVHPRKVILGIPHDPSHPMAIGLQFLARTLGIDEHNTLEATIAATQERCRQGRLR